MNSLRVLSWNIHANCGIRSGRLDRVIAAIKNFDADIVLLQEVSRRGGVLEQLRSQLGLPGWHFSRNDASDKEYGNVIASRYPVRAKHYKSTPAAPWLELLAYATLDAPTGPVEVVSAHMPNGSEYGWKKIETFEALASLLTKASGRPWIVGGDFNEPQAVLAGNRVLSFGANDEGEVVGMWRGHPNTRWQAAVEKILGPTTTNVHAWLARNEGVAAATHVARGQERFFDHLLTSEHFEVDDAGFEHGWRQGSEPMSDHSGAWATISTRR